MRSNRVARKTIDEESLNSEDLWSAIRYLDPDSDRRRGNLPAVIAVLLLAFSVFAIGLCLHFRAQ
jgi:hypothetical protein